MSPLQAALHISSRAKINLPPREGREWLWSGLANTLVHNDKFALLVDTSITVEQNQELIEWIKEILGNKPLTHLFITHGHKDHYLGVPTLIDAFPDLKILATKGTVKQKKIHDDATADVWPSLFPDGQLDLRDTWSVSSLPISGEFDVLGTKFHAISLEHGDCAHASILHVPELNLVCAGDSVIATHLYLAEANTLAKRKQWLEALDTIEALKPHVVIPGHMRAGQIPEARFMIEDTRTYIKTWEQELARSSSSDELFENMRRRYPERFGHFVLQRGADAAFQQ